MAPRVSEVAGGAVGRVGARWWEVPGLNDNKILICPY